MGIVEQAGAERRNGESSLRSKLEEVLCRVEELKQSYKVETVIILQNIESQIVESPPPAVAPPPLQLIPKTIQHQIVPRKSVPVIDDFSIESPKVLQEPQFQTQNESKQGLPSEMDEFSEISEQAPPTGQMTPLEDDFEIVNVAKPVGDENIPMEPPTF